MPNLIITFISAALAIIFVSIVLITSAVGDLTSLQWGSINYFDQHGPFLLLFIAFFPRLTLLFSSIPSGGILWWFSWLVAPRLLVAILATFAYLATNPFLVFLAWLLFFAGEGGEKYFVYRRARQAKQGFAAYRTPAKKAESADAIEVSYKVKSEE